MTTLDVIALVILAVGFTAIVLWQQYRFYCILQDEDHPEHDLAKDVINHQPTDHDWLRRF